MVTRGWRSRNLYNIAFSPDYLANNGIKIKPYVSGGYALTAPLISPIPHELSVSWSPSSVQALLDSTNVTNKVTDSDTFKGVFNIANQTVAGTVQTVDGYNLPEFPIDLFLSSFHDNNIKQHISTLVKLASSPDDSLLSGGHFEMPYGYKPPKEFFSNINFSSSRNNLSLEKACTIQIGTHRIIRGLLCSSVSLIPSAYWHPTLRIPAYFKVNLRMVGARVFFGSEQLEQWNVR